MAATSPTAEEILRRDAATVAAEFGRLPQTWVNAPASLIEAMQYSLLAGGKRLRPALVLECCRACGGDATSPSALASASAMELIHTFSLVHDDLPAMDDDDLRRGRPTNHKVFGEAMAILAGDAMVTIAFELLATQAEEKIAPKLIAELAHAAGPAGMIGGQVIDMQSESVSLTFEQLRGLHAMKTGALLVASSRMGAICAGASDEFLAAVTAFARHIGLAFQIIDDLLDVTATPEQLGKSTNKDAERGKNTYPSLLGVDEAKAAADRELTAALATVAPLGAAADGLRSLANFVVQRSS
jgi:geranylgeranyl diphosphate synthase type II